MSLENTIIELTDQEGPNIPLRTLAIYCGVSHSTLSLFKNGKIKISEQLRAQIWKGLKELAAEIDTTISEGEKE